MEKKMLVDEDFFIKTKSPKKPKSDLILYQFSFPTLVFALNEKIQLFLKTKSSIRVRPRAQCLYLVLNTQKTSHFY